MKKIMLWIVLLCLSFSPLISADYQDEIKILTKRVESLGSSKTGLSDSERFAELVNITYEYTMLSFPEFATYLGDPRGQDRWTDQSEKIRKQRDQDEKDLLAALANINRDALSASEQVNYDLLYDSQKLDIEGQQFPGELMPINQMGGVQQDIASTMAISRPKNAGDYANMVARLEQVPQVVEQAITLMRKGMGAGFTPPAITLRDVPQQIRNQLVDEPENSPMLGAFGKFPANVDSLQQKALKKQALAAFGDKVVPAFEKLLAFMENEYIWHGQAPNKEEREKALEQLINCY